MWWGVPECEVRQSVRLSGCGGPFIGNVPRKVLPGLGQRVSVGCQQGRNRRQGWSACWQPHADHGKILTPKLLPGLAKKKRRLICWHNVTFVKGMSAKKKRRLICWHNVSFLCTDCQQGRIESKSGQHADNPMLTVGKS